MANDVVRVPVTIETKSFVGIDASLSSTGFCIKVGPEIHVETIKSKPNAETNDLVRLKYIVGEIARRIPKDTSMICMEDFFVAYSVAQIGASIKLIMLATAIRLALYDLKFPFVIVSPRTLKKYILGKGVGQKNLIIREVYKKYGVSVNDDNQADGYVLAHIAEHLFYRISGEKEDLPKYQIEVLNTLTESLGEKGYNLKKLA